MTRQNWLSQVIWHENTFRYRCSEKVNLKLKKRIPQTKFLITGKNVKFIWTKDIEPTVEKKTNRDKSLHILDSQVHHINSNICAVQFQLNILAVYIYFNAYIYELGEKYIGMGKIIHVIITSELNENCKQKFKQQLNSYLERLVCFVSFFSIVNAMQLHPTDREQISMINNGLNMFQIIHSSFGSFLQDRVNIERL